MAKDSDQPVRRNCGTMEVHERLLRTVPGYREARDTIENYALRSAVSGMAGRSGCTRIPVVVHVVYKTNAQNISDAQIHSQIDVLNADFRKKNVDVSTVPAVFQPLADDARIEFELASTDPGGSPTDGITRTNTSSNSFSSDDSVKSASSGGADPWPSDKYLNMWVCQLAGGLLGYAQFPGGPAATDGVVITHTGFGTTGTAAAPFDLGRTATHEVGHWLNLRHIWGDDGTGCSGSDFVADTPNQGGANVGKPTFPSISCSNGPSGDLFMNYMDYVDDDTMVMFTTGQVSRMQTALDSSRSTIGTTIPCGKVIPKELPKEFPKDPPKEFPKELPKEFPKDPPKEWPKDLPKDLPKELPFDPPKGVFEPPKGVLEPPKGIFEPPKGVLEPPKGIFEPPKGIFEPPKGIFEPPKGIFEPPKGIFEPPKGIFEPPKGIFEPPKGVLDPPKSLLEPPIGLPGPIIGPGIPFVLATPAGAVGHQDMARQQAAAAHVELLARYAQLHAWGMLDASGLAAWQSAATAYRQLLGS